MNVKFEIRNLQCSYDQRRVVLNIEKLDIYDNQITFFVGPSGVGKSTILETLGFMNNTIFRSDRESVFKYEGENVKNKWKCNDTELSEFRNKNFSFIFQQTNLMPNFSAFENVGIPALLQGKKNFEIDKRVREIIDRMGLPIKDRPIQQYSGGQRQRLAFARAMLSDFAVLFGDEPTGNLDAKSAENLMHVLAGYLKENRATAVIVSHDLNLAIRYANRIILIQKRGSGEHQYGNIDDSSVFERDNCCWTNMNNRITDEQLHQKLHEQL